MFVAWIRSVGRAFCHENAHLLTLAVREVRDPEATAVLFDIAAMLDWIDPLAETVALGVPAVINVASDEVMDTLPGELLGEMP